MKGRMTRFRSAAPERAVTARAIANRSNPTLFYSLWVQVNVLPPHLAGHFLLCPLSIGAGLVAGVKSLRREEQNWRICVGIKVRKRCG